MTSENGRPKFIQIQQIYEDGELDGAATNKKYLLVQNVGRDYSGPVAH
jgi:hypothetical protein